MTDFQRQVLHRLESEHGIDADFVGDSLAQVIKGEKVEEVEERTKSGAMVVTRRKRTRTPSDVLAGLVVLDTLAGGQIGARDAQRRVGTSRSKLYGDYVPQLPTGKLTDVIFHEDEAEKQLIEAEAEADPSEGNADHI